MKYSIIKTENYVHVILYNNLHKQYMDACERNDNADKLLCDMQETNRQILDENENIFLYLLIYKYAGTPLSMIAGAVIYNLFNAY